MKRGMTGAHNELLATVWLLKQGFEVFRNVSAHGPIDLIAMRHGSDVDERWLLDVKSTHYRDDGSMGQSALTKEQHALGVKCMRVFPDGQCVIDESPPVAGATSVRQCAQCGVDFKPGAQRQRFCSNVCRVEAHMVKTGKTPKTRRKS